MTNQNPEQIARDIIDSQLDACGWVSWKKDKSLTDLDNLPVPDVLAGDIIENLEAGIDSFKEIYEALK